MSVDAGQQQDDAGQSGGDAGQQQQPPQFQPMTIRSQEELDRMFSARAAQAQRTEAAKYSDYGTLQEKAKKWDAHETESMDEVTRERTAREQAEQERDALRQEKERSKLIGDIAKEKSEGLPLPLDPDLLVGNTREEIEASAERLKAYLGQATGPRPPAYNPAQGNNNGAPEPQGDWLRNAMTGRTS